MYGDEPETSEPRSDGIVVNGLPGSMWNNGFERAAEAVLLPAFTVDLSRWKMSIYEECLSEGRCRTLFRGENCLFC